MLVLYDTNALSYAFARVPAFARGLAAARAGIVDAELCIAAISLQEIRYWADVKGVAEALDDYIDQSFFVLPIDAGVARRAVTYQKLEPRPQKRGSHSEHKLEKRRWSADAAIIACAEAHEVDLVISAESNFAFYGAVFPREIRIVKSDGTVKVVESGAARR